MSTKTIDIKLFYHFDFHCIQILDTSLIETSRTYLIWRIQHEQGFVQAKNFLIDVNFALEE